MGWLRDGSIPRFQGVSQLSSVQTKSKKELRQFYAYPKIKELPAQFLNRGGCAINKKIPFLNGADGVVSKFQQNKVRYADIYKEATQPFTNHPVCAFKERDLLLRRSHPSLK